MSWPDSLGLWAVAEALDRQIDRAYRAAAAADLRAVEQRSFTNVVVAGMGGSGIGADVASMCMAAAGTRPLTVVKDHAVPAWVDDRSLVITISFSGDTAETLDVARGALDRGASLVVCTVGGALGDLATNAGAALVTLDGRIPMPRAAIGEVSVPPLVVLERLGLLRGVRAEIDACVAHLPHRLAAFAALDGPAHRLAKRIGRTIPLVYGAGLLGSVAAYRFKCQVNENAKAPAFMHSSPELNHNELAGWGQHGDITRQILTAVHLRHGYEADRVAASFGFVAEIEEEVVAGVFQAHAGGDGRLVQLFDLIAFADFVSLHMARLEGLDPGPIPTLQELKHRLG